MPLYNLWPRAKLEQEIYRIAGSEYPHRVRTFSLALANRYNRLRTTSLDPASFKTAYETLAAKMSVTFPVLPADLSTLTDADLLALCEAFELAEWDHRAREQAAASAMEYHEKAGGDPTPATVLNTILELANYVRASRGLIAIV